MRNNAEKLLGNSDHMGIQTFKPGNIWGDMYIHEVSTVSLVY